jgi:hypothetical protein
MCPPGSARVVTPGSRFMILTSFVCRCCAALRARKDIF